MNPARGEWSDARLDDFYEEFRRVAVLVERMGVIEANLERTRDDAAACRRNVHELRNDMATAAARAAAERKSDKRWYVGTVLTSLAILIAATGIIVSALT